jgi:GTP diphosphokinase / guanosine-3',5'-bis(diphosphate) 3'-diphosphatase
MVAGRVSKGGYRRRPKACYSANMTRAYDIGLVIRAVEFAAKKHRMQRRKDEDASPYINHPIALMHVLCIDGGITNPTILAAAAL